MPMLFSIMFLTMFLPLFFLAVAQYINTANAISYPVSNVPFAPGFVLTFGKTPSIQNIGSNPPFANPPAQLPAVNTAGLNPSAAAFIREAWSIITSNTVLNEMFNLQELPPILISDAYFHSIENTLEVFQVSDSLNISNAVSRTIGYVADTVTPSLFLNSTLHTIGSFLAEEGILTTSNARDLAQSYSRTLENALNAASPTITSLPHIDALVDGSTSFLANLGVSIKDNIKALAQLCSDQLMAARQGVKDSANEI